MGFSILKFRRSRTKNKKYDAIVSMDNLQRQVIPFGDTRKEHFYDGRGLNLYSHMNHRDEERRRKYLKANAKHIQVKLSPSYFTAKYLYSWH